MAVPESQTWSRYTRRRGISAEGGIEGGEGDVWGEGKTIPGFDGRDAAGAYKILGEVNRTVALQATIRKSVANQAGGTNY